MRARASRLRSVLLAWCLAPAMLMPATGLRAAEPGGMLPFSGELHSSTKVFPARLAAFASCADRPRIFGKVEGRRYRIDLPAGTRCMVFVGEHEWEAMPLVVEDVNVTVPLPLLVYARQVPQPEVARELLELGRDDQALRGEHARPNDPDALERLRVGDEARQRRLAAIIATHGWPTLSMVGWEAANAAWLIAQHAPLARLKPWLALMQDAAARHEIAPYNLATSIDRVLVYEGRKQVYGTQYRPREHGPGEAYPSENMDRLEQRRLQMGLPRR